MTKSTRSPSEGRPSVAPPRALAVDRDGEVPIGVQLAWAIRTRIDDRTLAAGERLPGLRDLAQALEINANTVRAVYARLEREGLLESRQGSGTFVAAGARTKPRASAIAARAAREAVKAGVDPREVASALYVQGSDSAQGQAGRRHTLRAQISALEQALGELEADYPALALRARQAQPASSLAEKSARLPSAAELEQVKTSLLRRLSAMQASIDEALSKPGSQTTGSREAPQQQTASASSGNAGSRSARRPTSRPAPAGA